MMRQLFWLLLVLSGSAIMYSWLEMTNKPEQRVVERELVPDFVAYQLIRTSFDKNGNLAGMVRASQMSHFEQLGQIQLEQPAYTLFEQHLPRWQISSGQGVVYLDDKVILEQNVIVDNLRSDELFEKVETNQLEMLMEPQILQTDHPVKINGVGFVIQGQGMRIDLQKQTLRLNKHKGTVYRNEH